MGERKGEKEEYIERLLLGEWEREREREREGDRWRWMPASVASEWFQIQFRFSLEIFIDRKRFSVLLHQKRFLAKKGIWVEVSKNHPKNCSVFLWNRSWRSSLDWLRLKIKWTICRNQFPSKTNRKSFSNYQLTCDAKTSCRSFFSQLQDRVFAAYSVAQTGCMVGIFPPGILAPLAAARTFGSWFLGTRV